MDGGGGSGALGAAGSGGGAAKTDGCEPVWSADGSAGD